MCEEDIDEQCDGPHMVVILGIMSIAALIFLSIMFLIDNFYGIDRPEVHDADINTTDFSAFQAMLVVNERMWEVENAQTFAKCTTMPILILHRSI